MAHSKDEKDSHFGVAVPSNRISRFSKFGGLATSIVGDVAFNGAREFFRGNKPDLETLLLTPSNARRMADELSRLRGAAMKVGQMISMDGGDLVPSEFADILARLRADAKPMPPQQLKTVLTRSWGKGWLSKFKTFDPTPIAAASIGQVHRAQTKDGRDLAIKVQYPGVARSIDSDVDNVAMLIGLSGLIPKTMDLQPVLAYAKAQLHEEADYQKEAAHLRRFGDLLASDTQFIVPAVQDDLTTQTVLAMTFVAGTPIEERQTAPQKERDRIVCALMTLLFRELFEFQTMQTDPNFANFQIDRETGKIVLLDFGATQMFSMDLVERYRSLLSAGLGGDRNDIRTAAIEIGFFSEQTREHHQSTIIDMITMAVEPLQSSEPFDFGDSDLALRLRDKGLVFTQDRTFDHLPPTETMFLQRKFAGIYLIATRLKARVDVRALLTPYIPA